MNNHVIKWLFHVPGKKKLHILTLTLVQSLVGMSGVLQALLLRNIVDSAAAHESNAFWHYLLLLLLLFVGTIALRAVIRWLNEFSKATLENIFKSRLMGQLLRRDFATVNAIHSGEWLNRLTSDTVVVAEGYVEILPGLAGMAVKLISALIMIIALDRVFAGILIPGGIAAIALTYFFRKRLKLLHKNIQEQDGRLRVFLQERISSMMVIRSFATEEQTEQDAGEKMAGHKAARMRRVRFSNICNIGFGTVMDGMFLFGVGYCGYGILTNTVSFGTLTAIIQLITQIQTPFANITGYLPKFYAMLASAERLMEIESYPSDETVQTMELSDVQEFYNDRLAAFGLRDASFTYYPAAESLSALNRENMPAALENLSLEVRKGDYVAFTGQSGCGKSTALKLLMGVYRPDAGERFIEDREGNVQPMDSGWRRLFAYVPQGNQLMSGTIREIVTFADAARVNDDNAIRRALQIACADFVNELDDGIDTLLGERGTGLSEGQMQRIAIARAIFSESPVLLLDEATSALDGATERQLLENLRGMTDRTVIIVTHRPAALEICNRTVHF